MLDVHAICVSPAAPGPHSSHCAWDCFVATTAVREWQDLEIGQHAAHLRYGRDVVVAPWDPDDAVCLRRRLLTWQGGAAIS